MPNILSNPLDTLIQPLVNALVERQSALIRMRRRVTRRLIRTKTVAYLPLLLYARGRFAHAS